MKPCERVENKLHISGKNMIEILEDEPFLSQMSFLSKTDTLINRIKTDTQEHQFLLLFVLNNPEIYRSKTTTSLTINSGQSGCAST